MYYVGIDVGGMSLKAGIVDDEGKVLFKKAVKTTPGRAGELIVGDLANLIKDIISESKISDKDIAGVGMGFPGSVWDEKGVVRYCCNINLVDIPMVKMLKEKGINYPIYISNDANCAVLGEAYVGAAKGAKNVVLITIGTGLGTGIFVEGVLLTGNRSAGAEGGHMQINIGGAKCGCDKKGHYEAYASATALLRQAKEACEKHPESLMNDLFKKHGYEGYCIFNAAEQGDETAKKVIAKFVKYVGMGAVSLCNLFYPEYFLIGGGIANNGPLFIPQLQRYISRNVYGNKYNPKIKVQAAKLLNDAGIIGAACLVMNRAK